MLPVTVIRTIAGGTQAELAAMAGTSQPTIAAYERGSKSPAWSTITRIAQRAGLASHVFVGMEHTRDQARSLVLHAAIARALLREPERVIDKALANVTRMRAANPGASPLLTEWGHILELSPTRIAVRLLDPSDHGCDLRQVTPFAGVLTAAERSAAYQSFRQAA